MRSRCESPKNPQFKNYGARGISVCERWQTFANFIADMGAKPSPKHSIDRIDNDGDYEPQNCRWADRRTQQKNRRNAVYVTIEGQRYWATDLAEKVGVKTDTIIERAAKGLPLKKVLSKKPLRDLSGFALGGKASGAKKLARTHCREGHEFTPENTYWRKDNTRQCRVCHNAKMRRINATKRAQASL